ncbi:GIY-YIG nuclease family protein [Viridibacillus sp. FSL R5-0468]|uniref:GIY-YIG nuclease family protein n=1 Tax=Viridibacillus sp. FSL R5-0468 TaxID=2921640 RepID=UPI0030FA358E
MKKQKEYYVYFYYNENDVLLYVGLSNDVGQRFNAHQESWKSEVKKIGVRQYQNKTSMQLCEKYYIAKWKPKYNIKDSTKENIDLHFSDPVELKLMSRNEFINKYCNSGKIRKKRLTFKEELLNSNCKIIRTNSIDLFDESIWDINLDETVFLYEDTVFYFNDNILKNKRENYSRSTNSKIKKIKRFFNNDERIIEESSIDSEIMPFNFYFNSPKVTGGCSIISSMRITSERVVTNINFSDFPFLIFSENQLTIRFDKFIEERK